MDTHLQTDRMDQVETILSSQTDERNRKLQEQVSILRIVWLDECAKGTTWPN